MSHFQRTKKQAGVCATFTYKRLALRKRNKKAVAPCLCDLQQLFCFYNSVLLLPFAYRFDGLHIISAIKIKTAVAERLIGYAVIIVWKVWLCGKTALIQTILIPQMPIVVRIAGVSETPKPRR